MSEDKLIKLLKIFIVLGLFLLLLGHYLLSYANLPEKMGVTGIIISAVCIALGLFFSLPTKMYLTFILVTRENNKEQENKKKVDTPKNNRSKNTDDKVK
ncbi:hypothetical protein [Thalassotalea piscium]|uniref:Uncharacterized protein YacL n=1 Tax=Thalassotalea piscium TaxID=1230533 RepID=A0A7X0NG24_9GAMM|nr:hypothetical protein [Thalassotalea piscium]MBB6542631.1 uncharacterized protein YacL [Thalassotalea piscium]